MASHLSRRTVLKSMATMMGGAVVADRLRSPASAAKRNDRWRLATDKGLKQIARTQSKLGHWPGSRYPTALTALGGMALLCSGSTATQGPYARNIRRVIDYLVARSRPNGLIGDPLREDRYTYGHGFSMLFLSDVLGEGEDEDRRLELIDVLTRAVRFSGQAQATSGGWGYVSAKDQPNFDEGSTTITQVQGLRGCRNAGIPVPTEIIERAKQYIYRCKNADGGISYSSRSRGPSRPAITAAALAALYNAGDYDSEHVPEMLAYCKKTLFKVLDGARTFGHWHYTYLYYAQVVYRQGGDEWDAFRDKLYSRVVNEQNADGSWPSSNYGPIYVASINLIILQLDQNLLPIFQR